MAHPMNETMELAILLTSDVHGNVYPIHYSDNRPMPLGFAKLAARIRKERERHPRVLLIDNGDLIQGTPLTYHYARVHSTGSNPMIRILNELAYDAAVIGNHEFNYGLELLRRAVSESRFPWLSANIVDKESGEPFFGSPYRLFELPEGARVAVLGLTTPYIPNWENPRHIEGIDFRDAAETAAEWVKRLKEEERADVVIVSYHGGFERDLATGEPTEVLTGENQGYELCMRVPAIDVLLTGHQHRLLTVPEVNGVTVLQPGYQGGNLGKVTVTLRRESGSWTVAEKRAELLSVAEEEPDAAVLELAAEDERETQKWLDRPIGRAEGNLKVEDPMQARLRDHPFIEFINRVQMDASGASISNTALFDNLSPGFGPVITMRDVVSNYIYPNTLKVIRVTGQDIRDALERSAGYFTVDRDSGAVGVSPSFSEPKPQHYNYDMWEGIEYTLDISRPEGQRVVRLQLPGEKGDLDPAREFDVVMNHYRAGGGGDYVMFKDKPVIREINVDVAELLANYILEKKNIAADLNRNWEVVW